jgi:hypothetical protein
MMTSGCWGNVPLDRNAVRHKPINPTTLSPPTLHSWPNNTHRITFGRESFPRGSELDAVLLFC